MSKLYDEYFSNGDVFDGLSHLMYDIRNSKVTDTELSVLADELVSKGDIPLTSSFEKKKMIQWTKGYVDFLMYGMSTGRISKDYLLFYAKVSRHIKYRGYIIGVICIVIVVAVVVIAIILSGDKSKVELSAEAKTLTEMIEYAETVCEELGDTYNG